MADMIHIRVYREEQSAAEVEYFSDDYDLVEYPFEGRAVLTVHDWEKDTEVEEPAAESISSALHRLRKQNEEAISKEKPPHEFESDLHQDLYAAGHPENTPDGEIVVPVNTAMEIVKHYSLKPDYGEAIQSFPDDFRDAVVEYPSLTELQKSTQWTHILAHENSYHWNWIDNPKIHDLPKRFRVASSDVDSFSYIVVDTASNSGRWVGCHSAGAALDLALELNKTQVYLWSEEKL